MKRSALYKDETGAVLLYVTIVLVMSMLIIPPVLGFVGGAGRSAQIREDRMLTVYAADTGIEDGYFRLLGGNITTPWTGNITNINGCDVLIEIQEEGDSIYKIISTATDYMGNDVSIESYAAALDYSFLLGNALSSYGDITLKSGVVIDGNVTLNEELDNKGDILGDTNWGINAWPGVEEMKSFYLSQVDTEYPYQFNYINIGQDVTMGPLYRPGTLSISSSNSTATFTIDDPIGDDNYGTFYVTGDLDIGKIDQDFVLDLNNQTIFCASDSAAAIEIGGKCTLTGSGCIIAVGDVYFSPKIEMNEGDFIFVMSISGDLTAQPNGDFYGSMAGRIEVQYQPGTTITWADCETGLNFPQGDLLPGIKSYIIHD